jgi:RNA polymerase sigma-70 factor (ECF subfamily)
MKQELLLTVQNIHDIPINGQSNQRDNLKKLIRLSQAGDNQAFSEIVKLYQKRILSIACQITGNQEYAKDVVQDVFIRLYRFLPQYKNEKKFFTWLYRITVNVCYDHLKKEKRYKTVPIELESMLIQKEKMNTDILNNEIFEKIYKLTDYLSTPQKTSFILREIEGLPCKEIAKIMKCPQGTIRSYLFYARKTLKKLIENIYPELLEGIIK